MTDNTVIVIGGGAAGMIAAGTLKSRNKKVIIIEKNDFFGKKLRITGKGRCNITNIADIREFMDNIPKNGKFLFSAFNNFNNYDIIDLLNSLGVATKVERGGRVFPESDKAKDVCDALYKYATGENVKVVTARAKELILENGRVTGVKTDKGDFHASSVIIATGGKSYPKTGSTGDGYKLCEKAGHTIIPPKPSLVPLETEEKWVKELMGLTLKNVSLTLYGEGSKELYSDFGEMIFTHFGISGPIVLSASSRMRDHSRVKAKIDLKPALSEEQLDKRILRDFEQFSKKQLVNAMDELLPKSLIPIVIMLSEINGHKAVSEITKLERKRLCEVIKGLPLSIKGTRPIDEAIITAGGIKVSEINPSTMESKLIKNLYFAGEIIDVDAYTGGFNLQIAYSTGALAGKNCL